MARPGLNYFSNENSLSFLFLYSKSAILPQVIKLRLSRMFFHVAQVHLVDLGMMRHHEEQEGVLGADCVKILNRLHTAFSMLV